MEKIFTDLKKGVVAQCYLLYGEEEYLVNEAVNKILDLIVPEKDRDFGLFYLEGENTDLESLIDNILTPSLLGDKKVIVVKNATFFISKEDLVKLIGKIRNAINDNPAKATKYFLTFLKISGLSLEDLLGNGWQKITDEQWSEIVKGDTGEDREKWLPRILETCQSADISDASISDKTEKLEEILREGLPAGNCLVFTAESVDKRKKLYKMIADVGVVKEFVKVKQEGARKEIIQKEAQKLLNDCGKKISPAAWTALGRKTGFDLRRSMSELEKLISYTGERPIIEREDVEEAVGRTKEDIIFDLTDAIGEKNQQKALDALHNLLSQGIHHLKILTMVSNQIRLMLQARILVDSGNLPKFNENMNKDWFYRVLYPILSKLNTASAKSDGLIFSQHPNYIYNPIRNCVRFTNARLIGLLEELLNLERSFKSSGTSNPQLLLENFLIKSCA